MLLRTFGSRFDTSRTEAVEKRELFGGSDACRRRLALMP